MEYTRTHSLRRSDSHPLEPDVVRKYTEGFLGADNAGTVIGLFFQDWFGIGKQGFVGLNS